MGDAAAQGEGPPSLLAPNHSLWHRVTCWCRIWLLKSFISSLITLGDLPGIRRNAPTLTKVYQNGLSNRVFLPKSWKKGDAPLPLYIDIHGGGFCICSPYVDDRFCTDFSNDNNFLVVSLDYPKAPTHPFPAAVQDLTKAVESVMNDESLPFDKEKIAVGGFSAGANLALAICQDKTLQGRVGGVVSFYAPLDFTTATKTKLATRPTHAGPDPLLSIAPGFNWAYCNPGQDLKDPLLSPIYAASESLPPKIYFFGCEFDLLCRESEVLAERLAKERSGEAVTPGDLWEKKGIKWEKVIGEQHGFDASPAFGEKKIRVEKRRKEMFESAATWLLQEVYA